MSFLVGPGVANLQGPFIYPFQTGLGAIVLLDSECQEIGRFPVKPGDYRLTVDRQFEPSLLELATGERPSTTNSATGGQTCLDQ